ncbi:MULTISPECIES: four-carbon acid sugar kinase family protein [Rhizobium]|uniref:Four-carbon acid sugar kinase family protein n=1 Tax=Rhizobium lentis TaxID=1138194 RepID=A0ABS7ICH0_9HYPH|nr:MULTISPECIES: four-carbon acid sugar kinase family protein [Rhizobium]MBX4901229.1 four-carbon acid sugar kinase family protein [Rhizobium bangladeshense]MBX4915317.1 four-carbon acid sugar kinase family protein [Rhizobium bangladeshense]MBX4922179.1 four-carbon acid sugar kinase family protein [Rhizobium bangladeshense]MBX5088202.1 four-carbon acid sugar kinase family protein [Rhizobium lentis]MBX5101347.1 four-carbon acid sugar kinase family protein [Rhizobium lentis]
MTSAGKLKAVFYGDDFTGSSENLAQFHRSGVKAKLYLARPSVDKVAADSQNYDVLGFAGTARALSGAELAEELDSAFSIMRTLDSPFIQYKICSTFDSSPTVGSYGAVLDRAAAHFGKRDVPVLAATPDFGRYTCFGNHFARFAERIERLDRHPSMSRHPRTPMQEADLRMHLAGQTDMEFINITLPLIRNRSAMEDRVFKAFQEGVGVIFDGLENTDLAAVIDLLWAQSSRLPMFALAAQGLAQQLGALWSRLGLLSSPNAVKTEITGVENLLVLSGSCALQTGRQIATAEAAGWKMVHLDVSKIESDDHASSVASEAALKAVEGLDRGRPTIIYTARGESGRVVGGDVPAERLGAIYCDVARAVRRVVSLPRIVFSGGDSSSYAVRTIGAEALEIAVFDEVQNCHVCRLQAPGDAEIDGLEVMLKGGQIGADDFFLRAKAGTVGSVAA